MRDVSNAVAAVGCRVGGVELARGKYPLRKPVRNFGFIGAVGQIAGHQRREITARRQCSDDAAAIGLGRCNCCNRRRKVRHDNRARELPRGIINDCAQHVTVAQVDMPVIGAADRQALGH